MYLSWLPCLIYELDYGTLLPCLLAVSITQYTWNGAMKSHIVSVYGSSSPEPGSDLYEEAQQVGKLLAAAGYTVATGGYGGTMEAVSQGASEAGGHVIGVTSEIFETERFGRSGANKWVAEEIKFPTLSERLFHLVSFCDAAVSLRGGIGTLSEVAFTWSLIQVGEIKAVPFILLGKTWEELLTLFYGDGAYIKEENMKLWKAVQTAEEVIAALEGQIGG